MENDGTNVLATRLNLIQSCTRDVQPGVYLLHAPWTTYAVMTRGTDVYLVQVRVKRGAHVVISTDRHRSHGRPYRMRVNRARVMAIWQVVALFQHERIDHFDFGLRYGTISVGDRLRYEPFNYDHEKLNARGLYISPNYKEAQKLLVYIIRYSENRRQMQDAMEAQANAQTIRDIAADLNSGFEFDNFEQQQQHDRDAESSLESMVQQLIQTPVTPLSIRDDNDADNDDQETETEAEAEAEATAI